MGAGLTRTTSCLWFPGNPLLLHSSTPADLSVGHDYGPAYSPAYGHALRFQDAPDKELFDALPDIKVQSSFVVSLGVAERAELHAKTAAETFARDLNQDRLCPDQLGGPFSTAGVFNHEGGRLVAPNTGE